MIPTHRICRVVKWSRIFPRRMALFGLHVVLTAGRSPIAIRARNLPHSRQHRVQVLAATSSFDDGSQTPATEGAGWDPLFIERSDRNHESRKGGLQYHTSQGSLRFSQFVPRDGQGMFPRLLRPEFPCSRITRIRWPTNWTTSSSA